MTAPKLKPCPFCGGNRITFGVDYDFDTDGRYRWLECGDCGSRSRPHYHSAGNDCPNLRQEIRNEWNTRFTPPDYEAAQARIKALEEENAELRAQVAKLIQERDLNHKQILSLQERLPPLREIRPIGGDYRRG